MDIDIKIINLKKPKKKKCEECPYFIKAAILDQEIKKAMELQQKYLDGIKRVNETLAKYNRMEDSKCQQ